jgi:DNA-binding winged helix-turn-helix (wHTH) protein/TolB-like protein
MTNSERSVLRFADFQLDFQRAELLGPGGDTIKLRPKTFTMLHVMATNAGRVLSKQELMTAVWPNVTVGEDSIFQCIREIRSALGDDDRRMVKSVSGRGYIFEADVVSVAETESPATAAGPSGVTESESPVAGPAAGATTSRRRWGLRSMVAGAALGCFALGLAVAAPTLVPRLFTRPPLTIEVMPITATTDDPQSREVAATVSGRLTDGLSKIRTIRVQAPRRQTGTPNAETVSQSTSSADLVLRADLQKRSQSWAMQAQLINAATGEVKWSTTFTVESDGTDLVTQESRLAARIGYPVALTLNAMTHARLPAPSSKIVIDQANAFINSTSRERAATAQEMLEKALAAHPDDVDLGAALAAQLLRGIQTKWYTPAEAEKAEARAQALLEHARQSEPNYIPVLDGYCRFLEATNRFVESLVACADALSFDPWNGLVLFQTGMSQLQLGRFTDALATFQEADRVDTPQVSRWTWLLGAGFTLVMLNRDEEALPWLERSRAITPGTGHTDMVIAAADQRLGRFEEAKAALARGMALRPGTTVKNVGLPTKNESAAYLARAEEIDNLLVAAGLPLQ